MNNREAFFLTAVLTTAVFVAGHFANANKNGIMHIAQLMCKFQ